MNLHWSFRWGYGEDFLSNCSFKKRCVDSTPAPLPPGANRVNQIAILIFSLECCVYLMEIWNAQFEIFLDKYLNK